MADFSYLEPLCASAYFAMVRLLQDCAIVGKPTNWSGSKVLGEVELVLSQNTFIHVGAIARLICNDPSSSGLRNSWIAHELVWFHSYRNFRKHTTPIFAKNKKGNLFKTKKCIIYIITNYILYDEMYSSN